MAPPEEQPSENRQSEPVPGDPGTAAPMDTDVSGTPSGTLTVLVALRLYADDVFVQTHMPQAASEGVPQYQDQIASPTQV